MTAGDAGPAMSLVNVTRFRLRSIRFLPFFVQHANRTIAQIRKSMASWPERSSAIPNLRSGR